MRIPRNRYSFMAAAALVMMILTACTGGDGGQNNTATPASAAPATSVTSDRSMSPRPTEEPITSAATTAPPAQFARLRAQVEYRPGTQPASTNLSSAGLINVAGYIQAVTISVRDLWQPLLNNAQLTMPTIRYDAVTLNDAFVTACSSKTIRRNYGSLLYCTQDSPPDGYIALPTDVLNNAWEGVSRRTGDMTVAMSVSRQASLILVNSLQRQLGLGEPANPLYPAICLSGVWARMVYPQTLSEGSVIDALYRSVDIKSEVNGKNVAVQYGLAGQAWMAGWRSGNPAACGQFW